MPGKLRITQLKRSLLFVFYLSFVIAAKAQDFDIEVLKYDTKICISNGKLRQIVSRAIQINNRDGEKYTKIRIPTSPICEASKIKATLTNVNGNVIKKLSKNDIVTKSAISNSSFYEDDLVHEFTLKHNTYPYVLNYSYQVSAREFIAIDYWDPVINWNIPTRKAVLEISTPISFELAYVGKNIAEPTIDTLENELVYKWQASYTEIYKGESFAPPIDDFTPAVRVVPLHFNYVIPGDLSSWITYGNWENDLIKDLGELPQAEKITIDKLITGLNSDKEKIKKLYHYLQDETRYINISVETGGLKPYPATYVAQNKYGDCKALSNYFKAVLNYAGIKSYYSTIFAGDKIQNFNLSFPSHQFNHIILCVPVNKDTLWLDCTSDAAFAYVGTFIQNREVFVIDENKSFITKTPPLTPLQVLEQRHIKLEYKTDNSVSATFNTFCSGDAYEFLFSLATDCGENRKNQIIRNYMVDDRFELQDYSINQLDRDSVIINFQYNASANNYFQIYGNEMLVQTIPLKIPSFEKVKGRTLPVQINYPINYIDTLEFTIPNNFSLQKMPENVSLTNEYGTYSLTFDQFENKVLVYKQFLLNAGKYSIQNYPEFYKFIQLAYNAENKSFIVLTKK